MMRRFLSVFLLLVLSVSAAFALDGTSKGFLDVNLMAFNENQELPFDSQTQLWKQWSRPQFARIGFEVSTDYVDMMAFLPMQTDIWERLNTSGHITNVPFLGGTLDVTFPGLGYVDVRLAEDSIVLGVGRRQIQWGYGTYSMAIGSSQPYMDVFTADFNTNLAGKSFNYSFLVSGYPKWMKDDEDLVQKTLFAHRFGLEWKNFHFSIDELNLIYGRSANLFDGSPLAFWHDNFQDGNSNVMLNIQLEGLIASRVRVFGSFAMDDFVIGNESNGQPAAMGFGLGAEVNLMKSEGYGKRGYIKKDANFSQEGLNVGYEWYFCSAFMYNRKEDDISRQGRFTVPMHYLSNVCTEGRFYNRLDGFYLGFPYGPDTMVYRVYSNYSEDNLYGSLSLEAVLYGAYSLDSLVPVYGTSAVPSDVDVLGLNGPVTPVFTANGEFGYRVSENFTAKASLEWNIGYSFFFSAGMSLDF